MISKYMYLMKVGEKLAIPSKINLIVNFLMTTTLAKWLSVRLQSKWLWVRIPLQSFKLQISHLL